MKLTLRQLSAAAETSEPCAQTWLPHVNEALERFEINTIKRAAAFLAQVGHESGGLRLTTEIWGPTHAQSHYERDTASLWPPKAHTDRNWTAYELGNVNPGDGLRYRGRGPIQITGRANYQRQRNQLRVLMGITVPDFEADPTQLGLPRWGMLAAGNFWKQHGLNELADAGDMTAITHRINGGTTALDQRIARYTNAEAVLA